MISTVSEHLLFSFYNLKVRPSDVWIVTFPRSGTTVTQEMVWLLANDLDFETASNIRITRRSPFLEACCSLHPEFCAELLKENEDSQENCRVIKMLSESICTIIDAMQDRRIIKTHLPLSLLPKNLLTAGCKVVYVARNPKDVAVSFYHFHRLNRLLDFRNDFPTFWKYFTKNLVQWSPYWDHVFEAWDKRKEENLLFLFYENIDKDLKGVISKVQNFLGTKFTQEQLSQLENHLKIENFRLNKSVTLDHLYQLKLFRDDERKFIRESNSKKETKSCYFDDQLESEADEWISERLRNSDLKFPPI
ncbi:hypothetical protein WA026_007441 [Henosepilachna vigintioctopunctata]|uniref:Sulfotransferase domain-containing protein n=1 Tax=Henosepilachna vigintioctopunctata TaxID=420089 RepID=A0AAW1UUX2_9CUCU